MHRRAPEASDLVEALMARGVTPKTASDLVGTHPTARVRTKIEVFDWLMKNEDKRVGKNPAGYLVASIRSDYKAPDEYTRAGDKARAAETARKPTRTTANPRSKAREEAEQLKHPRSRPARAAGNAFPRPNAPRSSPRSSPRIPVSAA